LVTKDHYSSSDEYDHDTISEPEEDQRFESELIKLTQIVDQALKSPDKTSAVILAAEEKLRDFKRRQGLYALERAKGKDEFEHKLKRISNQQARANSLLSRLSFAEVQVSHSLQTFVRGAWAAPAEKAGVLTSLTKLDQTRHRRAWWVSGATSAAAIGAGTCYYFFSTAGGGL